MSRNGDPVWFELVTSGVDAARAFYDAVHGWQTVASPDPAHDGYRIAHAGDDAVAGIVAPQAGGPEGWPEGWMVYFATGDIDRDAARIADLGGTVQIAPTDIAGVGRFLVGSDPQGVDFALMTHASTTRADPPSRTFGNDPGHGCWVELATPDPAGAFAFYGALFGWTKAGAMPMGEMGDYAFIGAGGGDDRPAAPGPGAIMSSVTTQAPAGWNWYVRTDDIDRAAAAVRHGGGAVVQEPTEIPGGDHSALATDPAGHLFGLVGPRHL